MKHTSQFDKIAFSYYDSVPELPQRYIDLIENTFDIQPKDNVIELGCGSGNLAKALAEKSSYVQGLDVSNVMIELAEQKDKAKQVTWTQQAVEDFDLGEERYNLIIAFEAFHLFSNKQELIQRCMRALKPGGFLCVGWAVYEWELPLAGIIESTFAQHGQALHNWGDWSCPTFARDVKAFKGFSPVQQEEIQIHANTPVDLIVEFLFSISQTYCLNTDIKPQLAKELKEKFLKIFPTGVSAGESRYIIAFCRKL